MQSFVEILHFLSLNLSLLNFLGSMESHILLIVINDVTHQSVLGAYVYRQI